MAVRPHSAVSRAMFGSAQRGSCRAAATGAAGATFWTAKNDAAAAAAAAAVLFEAAAVEFWAAVPA
jgi:hypothetical protein